MGNGYPQVPLVTEKSLLQLDHQEETPLRKNHPGGKYHEQSRCILNANPVQYLATVGRDGKAKCRPFMFAGELEGKLWFCTNNQKDVYKDIQSGLEMI